MSKQKPLRKLRTQKVSNTQFIRKLKIWISRFSSILKLSIVFIIILLFTTNVFDSFKKKFIHKASINLSYIFNLKLNLIEIEGNNHIDRKDIIKFLELKKNMPMLALDTEALKLKLEDLAWVKHAIIKKQFPSTLYIGVIERKPIAVWQRNYKFYLIDEEAAIIPTSQSLSMFKNLLLIVGRDAPFYLKELIEDIKSDPGLASKIKSAIRFGERRWDLILEGDITVKMPEENFSKSWQYLSKLSKKGKILSEYRIIDLRNHSKYFLQKR